LLTTNEAWLEALRGPGRDEALQQLRAILVRGLQAILAQRVPARAEALAEDFAQEALLKILENLDTFRSESRFTTWAQKIAVRIAFTELRHKRWQDVSLQDLMPKGGPTPLVLSNPEPDPAETAGLRLIVEQVGRVMQEALSERQRAAMTAVMVHEMPLEEVARRMGTNRNALYKLLHDARKRMKKELEKRGLSPEEIFAHL
jgi:RNA polymerase sigma-70 factor (ECF subfamily)